jgi:hypothetical protein
MCRDCRLELALIAKAKSKSASIARLHGAPNMTASVEVLHLKDFRTAVSLTVATTRVVR